jgi:long-chain acyl-CoA synthetase
MTNALINRSYPHKPALITAQGEITYSQLLKHIQQYANLFQNKGFKRVAIYAENSPAWIFAFYAALQNNCFSIPIDFLASAEDVAYIIDDCRPDLLFISSGMKESLSKASLIASHQPEILVFDEIAIDDSSPESRWIGPEDEDTTAVIIYTSGTTGSPKGVMLSYTNLLENMKAVVGCQIFTPDRQVMFCLYTIFSLWWGP